MGRVNMLLAIVGIGLLLVIGGETPAAQAQGGEGVCPVIVQAALAATDSRCQAAGRNELCYGYAQVSATPRPDLDAAALEAFTFDAAGDITAVDAVQTVQVAALDEANETWGIALMRLQANLPDMLPGQNVTFLLFGDVTLQNAVTALPALATIELTSTGSINLRGGPSTSHAVVGTLTAGQVVTADGRLPDGSWLRIRHPESGESAWVFTSLMTPSGDVAALAETDSNLSAGYRPMQAFYFRTGLGDAPCAAAPDSGILFHAPGGEDTVALLNVNGLELMVGSTGLLQGGLPDPALTLPVDNPPLARDALQEVVLFPGSTLADWHLSSAGLTGGEVVVTDRGGGGFEYGYQAGDVYTMLGTAAWSPDDNLGQLELTMFTGWGKFPATHQVVPAGYTQVLAWSDEGWSPSGDPVPSDPATLSTLHMWAADSGTLHDFMTTGGASDPYFGLPDVQLPPDGGNGLAAIMVHGPGETGASWGTLADWYLQQGYAVISPDMPGYGIYGDMADPQWTSWPLFTDHLVNMAQLYGYDGGVLAGSREGADAAFVTCANRPDWCQGANLFSPTADVHSWGVSDAAGLWGDQGLFVAASTDPAVGTPPDVIDTLVGGAGSYTTWTTSQPLQGTGLLNNDQVTSTLADWMNSAGPTVDVAGMDYGPMPTSFPSGGLDVTGFYYPPPDASTHTAAVLFPNWGLGAESWGTFPDLLNDMGYAVYTWDMPGAGLPDAPGDPNLWPAIGEDAVGVAQNQGYDRYVFIGSSMGADLALYLCNQHLPQCAAVMPFSPGDYAGWGIPNTFQQLAAADIPVWLFASENDRESSGDMMRAWTANQDNVTSVIVPGDEHGIYGIESQGLYGPLGDWLAEAGPSPATATAPGANGLSTTSTVPEVNLDPTLASDPPSIGAIENLFLGLTDYGPFTGQVVPELATDWTVSEDGLAWTFNMRSDVNWMQYDPATGEATAVRPVTANDVVYGIQRACDPRLGAAYAWPLTDVLAGCGDVFFTPPDQATDALVYGDTVQVSAPDETTVVVGLNFPASYFLSMTPMWVTRPVPREAIEEYGDAWTQPGNIWTNGPYFVAENTVGIRRTFVRNENLPVDLWHGGNVDQVTTTVVTDPGVPLNLYASNQVDTAPVPASLVPDVQAGPHQDEIEQIFDLAVFYFGFNQNQAPFDDVHARRAFSAIIDRQAFVEQVWQGQGVPMIHFTPPSAVGAPPINEVGIGFDPEYAREQMAQAGYPDCEGFPNVDIAVGPHQEVWAAFWAQAAETYLGCDASAFTVQQYDLAVLLQTTGPFAPPENRPDAWALGWGPDYGDANAWVNDVLHCDAYSAVTRPCSEVDDLIDQAARETNAQTRDELYAEIEEAFFGEEGEFPIAPIYLRSSYNLVKPWYTGPFETDGLFGATHWDAYSVDLEAKLAARGG